MKIGIFDSGLGGLLIAQSIIKALPQYEYLYLGDTKRVPYGNRPQAEVKQFTEEGITYLANNNCQLIIVACNTASAKALRAIQQEFIPAHFPDRKVLGVIIPAVEAAKTSQRVGVLATSNTVDSGAYRIELHKQNPAVQVFQQAAPLLVPLIERVGSNWEDPVLEEYLQPLLDQNIDTLILGCTHYGVIKKKIRSLIPETIQVISQDEVLPAKLSEYLQNHPEVEHKLSKTATREYHITAEVENAAYQEHIFAEETLPLNHVEL